MVTESLSDIQAKMRTRDVSVFYGDKKAVDTVSIDIPSEYVTAFIGPSVAASRHSCERLIG